LIHTAIILEIRRLRTHSDLIGSMACKLLVSDKLPPCVHTVTILYDHLHSLPEALESGVAWRSTWPAWMKRWGVACMHAMWVDCRVPTSHHNEFHASARIFRGGGGGDGGVVSCLHGLSLSILSQQPTAERIRAHSDTTSIPRGRGATIPCKSFRRERLAPVRGSRTLSRPARASEKNSSTNTMALSNR
jgi:hypothetical protein